MVSDLAARDAKILELVAGGRTKAQVVAALSSDWPGRISKDIVTNVVAAARKRGSDGEHAVNIPVAMCRSSPTARPVVPIKVEALARSISDVGLRQPINVRPVGEFPSLDYYEIRGGGHRHAAFIKLGRDTIPAFVRTDDDLRAELAEIDENLVRNELSPAERAIAVSRRKAIYEELHPETKAGLAGAVGKHGAVANLATAGEKAERFTSVTAEATGASERTVQREAKRGEDIGADTLKRVVGTSLDKGEELDALAKLPEERRASVVERATSGEKVSAQVELKLAQKEGIRREREGRHAGGGTVDDLVALAASGYSAGVILADPPWRFRTWTETNDAKSARRHYDLMDIDAIMALPIAGLAAADCALFIWATWPTIFQTEKVIEAWGFKYSGLAWEWFKEHPGSGKPTFGTGYGTRKNLEPCLLATRGSPVLFSRSERDWLVADRLAHSVKPDEQYDRIERMFGGPYLELFARRQHSDKWRSWGNEVQCSVDDGGEARDEEGSSSVAGIPEHPSCAPRVTVAPAFASEQGDAITGMDVSTASEGPRTVGQQGGGADTPSPANSRIDPDIPLYLIKDDALRERERMAREAA